MEQTEDIELFVKVFQQPENSGLLNSLPFVICMFSDHRWKIVNSTAARQSRITTSPQILITMTSGDLAKAHLLWE